MFQEEKIRVQKLRALIQEYESILKDVYEQERMKIKNEEVSGKTAFEVASQTIFNQGREKGLEMFLRAIYDGSNK